MQDQDYWKELTAKARRDAAAMREAREALEKLGIAPSMVGETDIALSAQDVLKLCSRIK